MYMKIGKQIDIPKFADFFVSEFLQPLQFLFFLFFKRSYFILKSC